MTISAKDRIVVDGLTKVYHPSPGWMRALVRSNIREDVTALDGISFSIGDGEVCAIVGPNGAGKTTTFRVLVGLTTPSAGSARVMGFDSTRQSVAVRRLIGWMPGDDRSLLMRLNCTENLHFHGRLQGMKGTRLRRRIRDTLEVVGLDHAAKKTVFALSAGMRARLQLGRALLHEPEVLILDEPTGAVDPVAAHGLLNLITDIVRSQKLAAIISSHRLEEIEALGSRVLLLDNGKILYDGDLDRLRDRWDRKQVAMTFESEATAQQAGRRLDGWLGEWAIEGKVVRCEITLDQDVGAILNQLSPVLSDVAHIDQVRRPLRDLLAEMYVGGTAAREARPEQRAGRRSRR